MRRVTAGWLLVFAFFTVGHLAAQGSAPATLSKREKPKNAGKAERKVEGDKPDGKKAGLGATLGATTEPVTTIILADEAFFDSPKSVGTFSGHVVVNDPRFTIQSDKLTVTMSKEETQGLEKAIADGNVGVVRDRPDPKGGPALHSVGRAEHAIYTTKDGNVELTGLPRVQQGFNMHIATSPETVMILSQSGQLTTHGPSRTEIRQEPKSEPPKP